MFELLRADSLPVNRCLCELVMLRKASLAPWFGAPFQRLLLPLSCSSSGMARGDHSKVRAGGLIDGVKRRVVVRDGGGECRRRLRTLEGNALCDVSPRFNTEGAETAVDRVSIGAAAHKIVA